jgi:site-specific recombinase XerD
MNLPKVSIGLKDAKYPSGRKPVELTITYKKERKRILIQQTAHPDMWDKVNKVCTPADPDAETINNVISDYLNTANKIITKYKTNAELNQLPQIPETVTDIHREILERKNPENKNLKKLIRLDDLDFFEYAAREIEILGNKGKYGLKSRYSSAVSKYGKWCNPDDEIKVVKYISEMTTNDIIDYHSKYLIKQLGNEESTAHLSVRILKTIYGRARKAYPYLQQYPNPFENTQITVSPNNKEVERLTLEDIQKLAALDLVGTMDKSRDVFLFCYECLGIRVSDAICLKKSQIKNEIRLKARKTNKALGAEITPYMESIIDKYKDNTPYLFGLLQKGMTEEQIAQQIKSATALINKDLKKIGKIAGLSITGDKMRTHLARHSLAHHVYDETKNIQMVKEICQHSDIRITENYIGRLGFDGLKEKMRDYRRSIKEKGLGI